MSELKVYVKPIKTNMFGKMIVGQSYYLKSEVDKVIADKDKEIAKLKAIDVDKMADVRSLSGQFYRKSETDNVIADLEESHKKEVEQLLIEIVKLKADYKEACDRLQTANLIKDEQLAATRHHKHKRCLAMAEMCHVLTNYGPDETSDLYDKWAYIWQELAEKFKEAK